MFRSGNWYFQKSFEHCTFIICVYLPKNRSRSKIRWFTHTHTCLIFLAARKYRVRVPVWPMFDNKDGKGFVFFFHPRDTGTPLCEAFAAFNTHTRVHVPSYRPYIFVLHGESSTCVCRTKNRKYPPRTRTHNTTILSRLHGST